MSQDPQLLLEAALTTEPDDPQPDWYDITKRILWGAGGGDVTVESGRQTELADIDPSKLAGTLKNNDGALTPNNGAAPAPFTGNWEQGRRLRLTERFAPDSLDTFDRTVVAGLGTNNTGLTYVLFGSAGTVAADYNVSGGLGRLTLPSAGASRTFRPVLPVAPVNVEMRACVDIPVTPTGGGVTVAQMSGPRFGATYYSFAARVEVGGAVSAVIALGQTELASVVTDMIHTPGTPIWAVGRVVGPELSLKVWLASQPEPDTWTLVHTDNTIRTADFAQFQSVARTGNTNVPFVALWHHAEVRELFPLFTGHLEQPSVTVGLPGIDQPCAMSAIDRLGRLGSITAFEGNLAEHIARYGHSSGTLALHVPLSDAAGPWMARDQPQVTQLTVGGFLNIPVPKEPRELITAASTEGPPGDDQSYATWDPVFDAEGDAYLGHAYLTLPIQVDVASTETIAVSGWWRPRRFVSTEEQVSPKMFSIYGDQAAFDEHAYGLLSFGAEKQSVSAGPDIVYQVRTDAGFRGYVGALDLSADGNQWDEWRLVTIRFNLATKVSELWIGSSVVRSGTASAIDVTAGGMRFRTLRIGLHMCGSIAHLQVRAGSDPMTYAEHLAQYDFGRRGLEGQTVAERIATLAQYAGVPDAYVTIDRGASTPMQKISMAGKTPAVLMADAARTGQDLLLVDPTGQLVLVPRQRRYNQPVTATIPFGWLTRRTMAYRPEAPISDVTASRTGRGSVSKSNRAASNRYTVRSQSYQLDTLVDADPGNLAAWTLRVYDRMRTRIPALRINMLNRTAAQRKALLRLKIGDRIQLTGMPPGSPADVPHLIIQGIKHTCGRNKRVIEFNTSPLLGDTPGAPPACPVVGTAVIGPDTRMAY